MTERKICESTIEQIKIAGGWEGGFKTVWIPIEPQPCCANCQSIVDENDYGNLILCNHWNDWKKKTHYCSDWEAKK